jgi:hypothetical protein
MSVIRALLAVAVISTPFPAAPNGWTGRPIVKNVFAVAGPECPVGTLDFSCAGNSGLLTVPVM